MTLLDCLAGFLIAEVAIAYLRLSKQIRWLHDVLIPWMNSIHNEIHGVDSSDP